MVHIRRHLRILFVRVMYSLHGLCLIRDRWGFVACGATLVQSVAMGGRPCTGWAGDPRSTPHAACAPHATGLRTRKRYMYHMTSKGAPARGTCTTCPQRSPACGTYTTCTDQVPPEAVHVPHGNRLNKSSTTCNKAPTISYQAKHIKTTVYIPP